MRQIGLILLICSFSFSTFYGQTPDKSPLRLKVGTYNVGHFNEGELGGYQRKDVEVELKRWRSWVGEQSLDILSLNEWNRTFDKDEKIDAQKEILEPYYNQIYWGTENTWIYNGIATNYTLENIRQVDWAGQYYAIIGDLRVGEKVITIMSTHIPWQKEWHAQAIEDLIKEMKKYEYVICLGDINAMDATQSKFKEEGFNIANGGNQGFLMTAPASQSKGRKDGLHIDNIITSKNIKIFAAHAPANSLTARDHFPVIADLVVTW